jgi:hypothetical protein
MLRKIATDLFEILQDEAVSACAPPAGHDPLGQHDL